MTLVRWQSFNDALAIPSNVFQGFDEALERFWGSGRAQAWNPAVDIYENKDNVVVKAELPGIDPKEVEISVEDGTLYLKGERKSEEEEKRDGYQRLERAYGSFARAFSLPDSVDSEKVLAEYRDGLLTVTLPKREESKPKKVKISVK